MKKRTAFYLIAIWITACTQSRPAVLQGSQKSIRPEDYTAILNTWSRSTKIYQALDNKMFVTATYHAPEFRRAFAISFPEIYGHGGKITRRELVDLTGNVEQYHNFFLAVYTPNKKWNDLEQSDSIWRLTLFGESEVAVGPAEILSIKVDENLRAVYSFIDRFDECYLIRFPQSDPMNRVLIGPHSKGFQLRIASALGSAEMKWKLSQSYTGTP